MNFLFRLFPAVVLAGLIVAYVIIVSPDNLYLIFILNIFISLFIFFLSRTIVRRKIAFILSVFVLFTTALASLGISTLQTLFLSLALLVVSVYLFK